MDPSPILSLKTSDRLYFLVEVAENNTTGRGGILPIEDERRLTLRKVWNAASDGS